MEIKRVMLDRLRAHLPAREMTLLVGPRQVGKTTLLHQLQKELRAAGHRTLFLNLDLEQDFRFFASQQTLLQKLKLEGGGEPLYVFLDELQRKEDAGRFMKGIYDLGLPYKFILSGSGSLELKEKIHESMAGRKRQFQLTPVTFSEFLDYRTDYRYSNRLTEWFQVEAEQATTLLLEYLNYGGYPKVITEEREEEKIRTLEEVLQSYLLRDITQLLNLDRPDQYTLLLRFIANRVGRPLNHSGLAREIGLSTPTLKKYLWYAEKTFILSGVTPFFRNPEKELVKAPSMYFEDLGLRNFNLQKTGKLRHVSEDGFLFQNFIYLLLRARYHSVVSPIKYWRTQQKTEVDFVLERGLEPLPVEVKVSPLRTPSVPRSLRSFIRQYRPAEAWIINLSLSTALQIEDTTVRFRPWWELVM